MFHPPSPHRPSPSFPLTAGRVGILAFSFALPIGLAAAGGCAARKPSVTTIPPSFSLYEQAAVQEQEVEQAAHQPTATPTAWVDWVPSNR